MGNHGKARPIFSPFTPDGLPLSDFYATRAAHIGRGWFIYGRNTDKYGLTVDGRGAYVGLVGYLNDGPAKTRGWPTKRAALQAFAAHRVGEN